MASSKAAERKVPVPEQMAIAARAGDLKLFSRLLDEHPEQFRDEDGECGWFDIAADSGQLEIIKYLVSRGVDVNEPRAVYSVPSPEGVIVSAAREGQTEVVRWLLDNGANINFEIEGQIRCLALSGAARDGYLDVVKLLVERGAAVNACWALNTPLDFAISYGNSDIEEYLRSVGAKTAEELQG